MTTERRQSTVAADGPGDSTLSEPPVLEVRGAVKRFGAVAALAGVDVHLRRGEVLALLGDNGAGKSTLVKCISGVHQLDDGEVLIDGSAVSIRSPLAARALGIETVFQDLALFDNLSAVQNFFAGRELKTPQWLRSVGILRKKAMSQETKRILAELQVHVPDPSSAVGLMSGGQRQAIACARAAAFAQRIVVLDEPTAALGLRESRSVLDMVKRLPRQGASVIIISHNLEHVMEVADRAVVLRRGRVVGEAVPTPDNHELLVSLIVAAQD